MASMEGTESLAVKRGTESPAIGEQLMEGVCERENCKQTLARIKANKGSAGMDGMTVPQLPEHLKQQWPVIREQLLSGTYKPQPVKRVEIPKPDGGVRKLGIPSVLDRFIQQAVLQVLQRRWDRTFSDHSYGFRPGRSAHQALRTLQNVLWAKRLYWLLDIDIRKYFDSIPHSHLRAFLDQRVTDGVIRRHRTTEGTASRGMVPDRMARRRIRANKILSVHATREHQPS